MERTNQDEAHSAQKKKLEHDVIGGGGGVAALGRGGWGEGQHFFYFIVIYSIDYSHHAQLPHKGSGGREKSLPMRLVHSRPQKSQKGKGKLLLRRMQENFALQARLFPSAHERKCLWMQ